MSDPDPGLGNTFGMRLGRSVQWDEQAHALQFTSRKEVDPGILRARFGRFHGWTFFRDFWWRLLGNM